MPLIVQILHHLLTFHLTKYFTATWALEGHNPQAPDKLYAHGK